MIPPGLELEQDSFRSEEQPEEPSSSERRRTNDTTTTTVSTVELTKLPSAAQEQPEDPLCATARELSDDDLTGLPPVERVIVETVVSDEDSDRPPKTKEDSQIVLGIFPQNTPAAIRCTMTLLAACLVPAVALTLLGAIRSHHATGFLLLVVVWAVLLSLFAALVWFLQKVVLAEDQRNAQVFHPYIHAVADRIVQECRDFREDWKYEYYLMLEDGPASAEESEYVRMGDDAVVTTAAEQKSSSRQQQRAGRKPKSAIFRSIVKPIMRPIFSRRRKRKLQKQQEAVAAAENYIPPVV